MVDLTTKNQKNIALITGATGGLGNCFVRELLKENPDEIWAFGRNEKKLEKLKEEFGEKLVPFSADLTDPAFPSRLAELLDERKPNITYLINNAGAGQFKETCDFSTEEIGKSVDLLCKAAPVITNLCLPYMRDGARILNICSAAAFQPVPHINFYAAGKAFARSYSRALNAELKPRKISVTAVCPGWIDTDFIVKELNGRKVKYPGLVKPDKVAKKAIKDAKKGKDMSVYSLYMKFQHAFVKLYPQKLVMKIWLAGTKKYTEKK